ncbi:hypothetical protein [Sulfidibacter corallicola]|uniref:Uncharacterized protein n=1 Tax=Sulfidibacter corallicola TaxID=2818388 RepID=A0A8A4TMB2_SULCO|nr:hypothetical protein [Sulfidibacter corallicola]QTD51106.1 hypothetical protein J3U87_01440 [Sulfidibacter corallicola]
MAYSIRLEMMSMNNGVQEFFRDLLIFYQKMSYLFSRLIRLMTHMTLNSQEIYNEPSSDFFIALRDDGLLWSAANFCL